MSANVVNLDQTNATQEMRRIRKGMAEHDCSMRTFVYIDTLERRLAALEAIVQAESAVRAVTP